MVTVEKRQFIQQKLIPKKGNQIDKNSLCLGQVNGFPTSIFSFTILSINNHPDIPDSDASIFLTAGQFQGEFLELELS
jgi:hypothetical protein